MKVVVKTVGELEALRSTHIASTVKGDRGKIIELVSDGAYVLPGDVLVRLDPAPFEEKIEKLQSQVKEQEACIAQLVQSLEWEKSQADHKNRSASLEAEGAKLEIDKIMYGDGPQEASRLKAAMQKAFLKYEELNAYSKDLFELEAAGFLNASELKQAQKKLEEEREAYEIARHQYETFDKFVFPMLVKKGETALLRIEVNREEAAKSGAYNIAKSMALLEQAKQSLEDTLLQLREAARELRAAEITAPAPGMVVLREEYRSSQKRKPRLGDIAVKNQPLIDLPDLSSMVVVTRVREVDLYKIGVGKKATVEVDAYPHLSLQGEVSSIGVLAIGDASRIDEKYFEVRIALDGSNSLLRPGMTARATIHSFDAEDVLTIPLYALFEDQNMSYCYVWSQAKAFERREIEPGVWNEQWLEVKNGLLEGENICLLNPFELSRS